MSKVLGALCLCAVLLAVVCEDAPAQEDEVLHEVACETTSLDVNCGPGKVIRFLMANYGRRSRDKCNPAALNFTEVCLSPTANETMFLKCDGRRRCDVVSSNYVFGDPCVGTEKYLEMEYQCVPGQDPRDHPDALITLPPPSDPAPKTSPTDGDTPPTPAPSSVAPDSAPMPTVAAPATTTTTTTAAASADSAALLYCNTQDLRRLDLDSNRETVLASGLDRSVVVDYDYARKVFVWTDSKLKSIFSAPMTGGDSSSQRKLLVANVTSYGVAVDWVHGHVYWTDTGNDVLSVARLDGTNKTHLFTDLLDEPRGIVLQPAEGWMYWSDWGEVPKIEKSGMDGSRRKVIVSYGLKWPNGLAIDLPSRRLFWIEAFHENLCSSGLEGEDKQKIIASSPYLKLPFSIDVYQDHVYWTEWTSNKENIFKAHKITGKNITMVLNGDTTLMGIKVYHPSKQLITPSACGDDNGGCSHLCLPSPRLNGSTPYACACPHGKQLQPDARNCSSNKDLQVSLLYCNRHDIRKYELGSQSDSAMMTGLERATVIDYHFKKKIAVWSDTDKKKIYRALLWDVGARPVVLAESVTSYGIALDWLHDHVYWTDTHNNRIDVADLEGGSRKTLFNTDLDEPRAIVLNPADAFMFWSDWGEVPKIERSGMDGTHRRVIVSRDIRWPNGLAIDFGSRQIFWVDGKLNYLSTADFDGAHRRNLITSASVMRHPFSLDVYEDSLFWVEWSSGKESVYKAAKADGGHVTKVFDGERSLMGLKVLDASKQPDSPSVCGDDNGGCSHLCLPAPGPGTTSVSCACPNHLHMTSDGFNCSATTVDPFEDVQVDNTTLEDKAVLLCANVDDIRVIDLLSLDDHRLIGDLTRAVAVDYHFANKTVFWTDIREDRICSAPIKSNGLATELVSDCLHPDGLAADWIHGHLYWTDKGKDAVGVANMDGTMEKTLFANDLDEPRAIALDPFEGWMFWTDWGRVPKIERAGMDGTRRSVVVSRLVQWPNGITVDLPSKMIYWADAKTHEICRANYDGSGRSTVLSSYSLLKQPFSIDVFQDWMYWVEWRSGEESVYKADKATGRNPVKIADGRKWKNLMTIKVYHSSKQPPGPSRCGSDNGGCSHLCLPSPRNSSAEYACACPNSLQLAYNGRDCLAEMETTTRIIPTETDPSFNSASTDGERAVLLYANKKDVRRLDLLTKEDSVLADGFSRASAIDFSYQFKKVYWTDYDKGQIYSAPFPAGSPVSSFIPGANISSNGLAVDWVHLNIYWTDNRRNSVDVCTMHFEHRKTLFRGDGVDEPRTIVLHPEDGWLFWADWGRVPKIERAGMDGSNRMTIVETGVDWTHALAIDLNLRKIYWADGDQKKIFSVNFDGSGRLTIVHAPDLLHLPFSMDILGDDLYWTEFMPLTENIFKTNKLTGENPVMVDGPSYHRSTRRFVNLMGIKIYHSSKQPTDIPHRCAGNKCSWMCLPTPRLPHLTANYSCACPNGRTLLPDGRTCSPEGSTPSGGSTPTAPSPFTISPTDSSASTDEHVHRFEDNKSGFHSEEASTPVGLIVGSIAALALIALVGVLVYHRHFLRRNLGNMVFNNPLYRKHKEDDFCIEKNSAPGRRSLVPLTSAEPGETD